MVLPHAKLCGNTIFPHTNLTVQKSYTLFAKNILYDEVDQNIFLGKT